VGLYYSEWYVLESKFRTFVINHHKKDVLLWRWQSKGMFYVHSLYKWLEYGGLRNIDFAVMWKTNLPLKIKKFIWLVRKNRVLTKLNLIKKGWNESTECMFCNEEKSTYHIFITCPFSSSIWDWIAKYNNFIFAGSTIEDLWTLDYSILIKN
jgi:zinc-binding in reverse transcriptase